MAKKPKAAKDSAVTEKPRAEKMSERELLAIVDGEIANALGKMDTKLSNARLQAMKYYLGDLVGNLAPPEAEGRSRIVSMDVADTIEWILPTLIKMFTAGENAVEYAPRKAGDEQGADQMTNWGNHVFYTQNEGFIILHDWFKDALLQKLGIVKVWWDDSKDITTEEYEGLTLDELTVMLQDGTVEVIQQTPRMDDTPPAPMQPGQPPQMPQPVYDVKVKRTANTSHICIENVPPEEWLVSRKARTSKRIFSCHHRVLRTVTELKEAGYKNTDELMSDDNSSEFSQESVERDSDTNEFTYGSQFSQPADKTMRLVWITESYLQVDWDGDGLAEWRKVVKSGKTLLDNDEIDEHVFSLLTPIKMPHKLIGRSVADLLMDIQDIKTAITRQFIDNMYLQNNPRHVVDETKSVNIDDLLDNRVGGIIRTKGVDGVTALTTAPLSPFTFNLLDYMDQVKESRTGVSKTFQGLDPDTLNKNKTATAFNGLMNAAQQKVELIARIFAETGVKDLFRRILKLSGQYQQKEQVVRLTGNKFVTIDPRAWKNQYDIVINVGLGTGNKDQIAAHTMGVMQIQEKAMTSGLPIVSPKQIYNAACKYASNIGFKNPGEFFIDPESEEGQKLAQQAAQKPDPEMAKVQGQMQLEQAKAQNDKELKQQQMQLDQQKAQADSQGEQARLAAQAQVDTNQAHLDAQLEQQKHDNEMQAKITIARMDNETKITIANIQAENALRVAAMHGNNPSPN